MRAHMTIPLGFALLDCIHAEELYVWSALEECQSFDAKDSFSLVMLVICKSAPRKGPGTVASALADGWTTPTPRLVVGGSRHDWFGCSRIEMQQHRKVRAVSPPTLLLQHLLSPAGSIYLGATPQLTLQYA